MGGAFGVRGSHGVGLSGPANRRYRRQWRVCAAGKGKPLLPQQLAGQITDPRNIRISPAHARARGRAGLVVAPGEGYRSSHLGSSRGTTVSTVVSAARLIQALAGSPVRKQCREKGLQGCCFLQPLLTSRINRGPVDQVDRANTVR